MCASGPAIVFEKRAYAAEAASSWRAALGGGAPALVDRGAETFSQLGNFDLHGFAASDTFYGRYTESLHTNGLMLLDVARIPAGEFLMGAEDGEEDERPAHRAYLDEFCIGTHPVTNAEYAQFVQRNGPSVSRHSRASADGVGAARSRFPRARGGVFLEQRHTA